MMEPDMPTGAMAAKLFPLLFNMMGPISVIPVFAGLTASMDDVIEIQRLANTETQQYQRLRGGFWRPHFTASAGSSRDSAVSIRTSGSLEGLKSMGMRMLLFSCSPRMGRPQVG